jgi:hypothetical protein
MLASFVDAETGFGIVVMDKTIIADVGVAWGTRFAAHLCIVISTRPARAKQIFVVAFWHPS